MVIMVALSDLPDEVLGHVFALLRPSSRGTVRLVSKRWNRTAAGVCGFWDDLQVWVGGYETPDTIRVLCRLLATQKDCLRLVKVETGHKDASLGQVLSSIAGAPLQQLCFKAYQLHSGEVQVRIGLSFAPAEPRGCRLLCMTQG